MAHRFLRQRFKKREAGFALMESVVAVGFSAIALSASMVLLNRQAEMIQKSKDLAVIDSAVNEDISAIRHWARVWFWTNNYYYDNGVSGSPPPNEMIYNPTRAVCYELSWIRPGWMELNFYSDLGTYTQQAAKGGVSISGSLSSAAPIAKSVPGYQILRQYTLPSSQTQINATSNPAEQPINAIRVTYTVKTVKTDAKGTRTLSDYPYESSRDVLLPAQFSC